MIRLPLMGILWLLMLAATAHANEAPLPDSTQELRAKTLFHQLRCIVCEGQSLADSQAPMAVQMRILIRSQITDGMDDADILTYYSSRYGDEVLMSPPVTPHTLLLWLAPLLFVLCGACLVLRYQRRS